MNTQLESCVGKLRQVGIGVVRGRRLDAGTGGFDGDTPFHRAVGRPCAVEGCVVSPVGIAVVIMDVGVAPFVRFGDRDAVVDDLALDLEIVADRSFLRVTQRVDVAIQVDGHVQDVDFSDEILGLLQFEDALGIAHAPDPAVIDVAGGKLRLFADEEIGLAVALVARILFGRRRERQAAAEKDEKHHQKDPFAFSHIHGQLLASGSCCRTRQMYPFTMRRIKCTAHGKALLEGGFDDGGSDVLIEFIRCKQGGKYFAGEVDSPTDDV
ncbi:MAG: hypothetical protein BWY66_01744 [bacterium ADurb.Bin374]|nr:MAG: hypothetical protein BWY66_01744 [bacterium ADurb.Bin374]